MFQASRHDNEFSRADVPVPVPELDAKPTVDDEEKLVFRLIVVPDELSLQLNGLHE